jgi:hypothetical protein
MTQNLPTRRAGPAFSIPSILAIICAIGSFMAGAVFGFVLAILAIILGGIGLLLAMAPQTRGGIASVISILAGAIGIIAAVIKLIFD